MTEDCDWKCEYCAFSGVESPMKAQMSVYQAHLPYIKKIMDTLNKEDLLVNIDIQGGEVGLIDLDILKYFFNTIALKINVSTNGEFLKREYNHCPDIRKYLGTIMWHVKDVIYPAEVVDDYSDPEIHISRGIVHNNVDEIVNFICTNHHILFDYIEFEFNIKQSRKMNVEMYQDLLNKLEGVDNITWNTRHILRGRISERKDHRENCRKFNHSIMIDLANETLCFCQRQPSINIPLNKKNLIYRLTTFPKDIWDWTTCDSCTRLYAGKFQDNVIERSLRTRRLF
jgi:hypothetical protein